MNYLESLLTFSIDFFKNFTPTTLNNQNNNFTLKEVFVYIQFSSAVINFILFLLIILSFLNYLFNLFFKNKMHFSRVLKFINLLFLTIIIFLLIIKFYYTLKLEQHLGPYLNDIKLEFFQHIISDESFNYFIIFSSSFSDAILILSFITGLICLELLGYKNLLKNYSNITLFYFFNIFIVTMVSTSNLLIMFISFEFIFLPTMYFVYKFGYSKKIDKANKILFYWTLFGSFSILCVLSYIYYKFNTLDYFLLQKRSFSIIEKRVIFLIILLGFGIKIPLAPFHFWLLKVHVESPTAFSIFLSGFLVKSALYCLFMLLSLFNDSQNLFILTGWIFYSLVVSTVGLARQTDIKKLIAWATVQEMTFMLLFLVFKQIFLTNTCILFIILHGLMSSYMFYLVDVLQRRFKTRSFIYIKGVHLILPKLSKHIWFLILLFSGFPLTAKFFIEWNLISLMVETHTYVLVYIILFVNFGGAIFFCKIMFSILYGIQEDKDIVFLETQKKEYSLLNFLSVFILILLWLIYVL